MTNITNHDRITEIRREITTLAAAISHALSDAYAGRDGLAKAAVYAGQLMTECQNLRDFVGIKEEH